MSDCMICMSQSVQGLGGNVSTTSSLLIHSDTIVEISPTLPYIVIKLSLVYYLCEVCSYVQIF